MRTKEEILDESLRQAPKVPAWDATASLHERLTIEVLIDIRDILATNVRTALQMLWDTHEKKGGDINGTH